MDSENELSAVAGAAAQVQKQRALVVTLAKAKQFEQLPAAHQLLRQMEDALKLARAGIRPPNAGVDTVGGRTI